MNNKFKQLKGKPILSSNKNFSVYGGNSDISEAMKIANNLKKDMIKKSEDTAKKIDQQKINFEKDEKKIHHPTYEFSDDELKRRIEIAKERNKIAITSLNETSSLDDILSGVINDLLN